MNARVLSCCFASLVLLQGCAGYSDEAEGSAAAAEPVIAVHPDSDPQAVEIAGAVMDTMGGRAAWDGTRFVSWTFFGGRQHWWDRQTGDIRIEATDREGDEYLILMNIDLQDGLVWKNGELVEEQLLDEWLSNGHQMWVNDSYWVFMPYKLLDPGVKLGYGGQRPMEDGRDAEVLVLTFDDGTGYTPRNRYEVFVAAETGLVEQWAFFADADDAEPRFTMPWHGWERFGDILIATDHGREHEWAIAVHDELPESVFHDPAPVAGDS
jgi:hypothetical protein